MAKLENYLLSIPDRTMMPVPDNLLAYKKCVKWMPGNIRAYFLVSGYIPRGTTIYTGYREDREEWNSKAGDYVTTSHRKMRAALFKVTKIERIHSNYNPTVVPTTITIVLAHRDENTKYRIGRSTKPHHAFDNKCVTCSSGIHFFSSKEEAFNYNFN